MSSDSTTTESADPNPAFGSGVLDKLKRPRLRLLDLPPCNRLLNFSPVDRDLRDDRKGHKHLLLNGKLDAGREALVEDGKKSTSFVWRRTNNIIAYTGHH
jgi:hypothetical protein